MKYSLNQTNDLIASGTIQYEIPECILQIINEMSSQVGAPNYVKTPVFIKKTGDKERKNRMPKKKKERTNDDWTKQKAFKTTKIEKSVGMKKNTDDIRYQLNKLSDKNFDDVFNGIVQILDSMETYEEVGNIIFDLASSNRFYSQTYAKLYCDLTNKYEHMKTTMYDNIDIYIGMFDNIQYVDPNDNYEEFCDMNKANERRKALSAFLVNMMKNNMITRDEINQFLIILLRKFDVFLTVENKKNEVNEICENFCILFDSEYNYENNTVKDAMSVNEYLGSIATTKVSNYKSFTNKTKFKIMDLLNI